jgi:hypothetical protein
MNSVLHPFGSATITLGEPVVSINCLIMSGSLAHINLDLLKANTQNNYKVVTHSLTPSLPPSLTHSLN